MIPLIWFGFGALTGIAVGAGLIFFFLRNAIPTRFM